MFVALRLFRTIKQKPLSKRKLSDVDLTTADFDIDSDLEEKNLNNDISNDLIHNEDNNINGDEGNASFNDDDNKLINVIDFDVLQNEDTNLSLSDSYDSFASDEESNMNANENDYNKLYSKDLLNYELFRGSDFCVGDFLVVMNILKSNYNISEGLQNS